MTVSLSSRPAPLACASRLSSRPALAALRRSGGRQANAAAAAVNLPHPLTSPDASLLWKGERGQLISSFFYVL